jgi:chaperonin cofactor prefoldin
MEKQQLIDELNRVHEELQNLEDFDDEVVSALGQLATDIRGLVDRFDASTPDELADEHSSLSNRIEEIESQYPIATRFLSQMTDFLAMIGI